MLEEKRFRERIILGEGNVGSYARGEMNREAGWRTFLKLDKTFPSIFKGLKEVKNTE